MTYMKSIIAGAALFAIAASANAQSFETSTNVQVSAKLVAPITLTVAQNMNFGLIVPGAGGGTVALSTVGARAAAADVTLGNSTGTAAAQVDLTGEANSTFSVELGAENNTAVVLVNPGAPNGPAELTLTNFKFDLNSAGEAAYADQSFNGTFSNTGTSVLLIGGRLNIPTNSPAGTYSTGTGGSAMTVTVNYN